MSHTLPSAERRRQCGRACSRRSLEAPGRDLVSHLSRQINHKQDQQVGDGAGANARSKTRSQDRSAEDTHDKRPGNIETKITAAVVNKGARRSRYTDHEITSRG